MSKKIPASKKPAPVKAKKSVAKVEAPVSTPVRYSALPKLTIATPAAAKPQVTFEQIATKAYELFAAGRGDSELGNWLAAEAELKAAA